MRRKGARTVGREVIYREELGSTQDTLMGMAAGVPDGTVLVAGSQLAGRGRMGRVWASPPGTLTFSVLLRPNIPPDRSGVVMLAAAVSLYDALERYVPGVRLEWPNDMMADGKLAGIVLDSSMSDALEWVVAGVGVNVDSDPREVAGMLESDHSFVGADSVRRHSADVPAFEILAGFLLRLDSLYADMACKMDGIVSEYQKRCFSIGGPVRREDVHGTAMGVGPNGELAVETDTGIRTIFF